MSFPEKLKAARQGCGFTQQEIAQRLGIDKTTYSGYETGRRQPDVPKLRRLAQILDITCDELLEFQPGVGSMVSPEEMRRIKKFRLLDLHGKDLVDTVLEKEIDRMTRLSEKARRDNVTYINCYDLAVSAGLGEPWDDSGYKTQLCIPTERVPENAHYCARVNGSSMEPAYKDGDVVFVQRIDGSINEGEIGIFFLNGAGYIKRLGAQELLSLNPDYAPIPIHEYDDLRCQGRVLGKV